MDNLAWIKQLIRSELTMQGKEETPFQGEFGTPISLKDDTNAYLNDLKSRFVASCSAFNQLKGSTHGRIKIYGISKSEADFMIFRNGYKLIFSTQDPGKINVTFNHMGSNCLPGQETSQTQIKVADQDTLTARWMAFGQLTWTHKDQDTDTDFLIRHYLSRFIRISASV